MEIMDIYITIWYILCIHLVHFSGFGILHQEKSGNPDNNDSDYDMLSSCLPFLGDDFLAEKIKNFFYSSG
jgi:hypothetical protein